MLVWRPVSAFFNEKLTVPPRASPSKSGVPALVTSIPSSKYWEIVLTSVLLLSLSVEATLIPLIVTLLYFGDKPLITTLLPSPPSLCIETPGNRAIASAAFASGSSFNLSEETTFLIDFAFSCLFIAPIWPFACALTTTVFPSRVFWDNLKSIVLNLESSRLIFLLTFL